MIKKWSGPSLSKFPWKIRVLKFSSLRPLIRSAPLAKLLSRLPESPNQLTYFTIIISFVSKLSFSVKKLKKTQMGKKLWLLEVTVKNFFELVLFKWCISQIFFFKNHKTELMGVYKIKKYVLTQKISLLAWKIAVLQTFLYHFRTPENPNISKAHIFWWATVMIKTKLVLTWFDIILSLEHSGAWPHGAFLISSILRAVVWLLDNGITFKV